MEKTSAITPPFYLLLDDTNRLCLEAANKTKKGVWKVHSLVLSWFNLSRPWVCAALPDFRLLTQNKERDFCPVMVLSDALSKLDTIQAKGLGNLRAHLSHLQEIEIDGDKELTYLTQPKGTQISWKWHLKASAADLKRTRAIMEVYEVSDERVLEPLQSLEDRLSEALSCKGCNRALKFLWKRLPSEVFEPVCKLRERGTDRTATQLVSGPVYRVWHEMLNLMALDVTERFTPERIIELVQPVEKVLRSTPPMEYGRILLTRALKPLRKPPCTSMEKARVFQLLMAIDIRAGEQEITSVQECAAPAIETFEARPPPPWILSAKSRIGEIENIDCFLPPRRGFQLCQVERNIALEAASCWLGVIKADEETALKAALGALLNTEHAWLAHCGLLPEKSILHLSTLHPDDHLPKNLEMLLHTCHEIAKEAKFQSFAKFQPLLGLNGFKPKRTDDPVGTILKAISLLLKQIQQPT